MMITNLCEAVHCDFTLNDCDKLGIFVEIQFLLNVYYYLVVTLTIFVFVIISHCMRYCIPDCYKLYFSVELYSSFTLKFDCNCNN